MLLIVSGISINDRSGRITISRYAIEHSHLPLLYPEVVNSALSATPYRFILPENFPKIMGLVASSARCSRDLQDRPERPLPYRCHSGSLW